MIYQILTLFIINNSTLNSLLCNYTKMNYQQNFSLLPCYAKACGKVLVSGGYGVLEPQNIGLSLALQTFFFTKAVRKSINSEMKIVISSPQIRKIWTYTYNQNTTVCEVNGLQNIFVENAVRFALKYLHGKNHEQIKNCGQIDITILFDKGFISEKNITKQNKVIQNEMQQKFVNYEENYSKTGLGSSACVLVSIVKVLLTLFKPTEGADKNVVNVISQIANLAAQKKIGSNFDISTAIYGTHLYKNILPQRAYECVEEFDKLENLLKIDPQIDQIASHLNKNIKQKTIAFMVDIAKGANTRKMVGSFLKKLRQKSQQIQKQFFCKSKRIANQLYETLIDQKRQYEDLKKKMKEVNYQLRNVQQIYSKITQTDVEPEGLREPLNNLLSQENILYAVCPGSGGWDAFFVLAQKDQRWNNSIHIKNKIKQILQKYSLQCEVKQVHIKWDEYLQVNQGQQKRIQEFLQKNQCYSKHEKERQTDLKK